MGLYSWVPYVPLLAVGVLGATLCVSTALTVEVPEPNWVSR